MRLPLQRRFSPSPRLPLPNSFDAFSGLCARAFTPMKFASVLPLYRLALAWRSLPRFRATQSRPRGWRNDGLRAFVNYPFKLRQARKEALDMLILIFRHAATPHKSTQSAAGALQCSFAYRRLKSNNAAPGQFCGPF